MAKQLKEGWTDQKTRKKVTKTKRRGKLDDDEDAPSTFSAVYGDEQFIKKVCMTVQQD